MILASPFLPGQILNYKLLGPGTLILCKSPHTLLIPYKATMTVHHIRRQWTHEGLEQACPQSLCIHLPKHMHKQAVGREKSVCGIYSWLWMGVGGQVGSNRHYLISQSMHSFSLDNCTDLTSSLWTQSKPTFQDWCQWDTSCNLTPMETSSR